MIYWVYLPTTLILLLNELKKMHDVTLPSSDEEIDNETMKNEQTHE